MQALPERVYERRGVEWVGVGLKVSGNMFVCWLEHGARASPCFLFFPSFFIGVREKQSILDSRDVTKDAPWLIRSDTLKMNGLRVIDFISFLAILAVFK